MTFLYILLAVGLYAVVAALVFRWMPKPEPLEDTYRLNSWDKRTWECGCSELVGVYSYCTKHYKYYQDCLVWAWAWPLFPLYLVVYLFDKVVVVWKRLAGYKRS